MLPISLNLLIIAALSVSACSMSNQKHHPMPSNHGHHKSSAKDHHHNHHPFKYVECHEVINLLDKSSTSIGCNEPRIQDVKLIPPSEWRYEPEVAAVKRCHGKCSSGTICLPKNKGITEVVVEAFHDESKMKTDECVVIEVEEHHECMCGCPEEIKEQCNSKQEYRNSTCECVCKDGDKKKDECESSKIPYLNRAMYGEKCMTWDPTDCSCNCSNKLKSIGKYGMCTSGRVWDAENCKCVNQNDRSDPDTISNGISNDVSNEVD